jgi:isochorismate pyruvate lyase
LGPLSFTAFLDRDRANAQWRGMTEILPPERCQTMSDVRAGVDQIDRELVALLACRFGFMDAAARIKANRGAVRDESRKQQVIDNVRREARAAGIPETVIAVVWDALIEGSIAYELERFDSLREDAAR